MFVPPWQQTWRRPKQRQTPKLPPPSLSTLEREFEDLPLWGTQGEFVAATPPEPSPAPTPQLELAPPDWSGELLVAPPPAEEPPAPVALGRMALDELKANDAGWDPPPPPGPAETTVPLLPVEFPQPDWRGEDAP